MNSTDENLFVCIKKILRDGYWSRFNDAAHEEMALAALKAILEQERRLKAVGADRRG